MRTEVLDKVTIAEILADALRLEVPAKGSEPQAAAPGGPDPSRPEGPAKPALEVLDGERGRLETEGRRRTTRRADR
jgi:hypothetical protein